MVIRLAPKVKGVHCPTPNLNTDLGAITKVLHTSEIHTSKTPAHKQVQVTEHVQAPTISEHLDLSTLVAKPVDLVHAKDKELESKNNVWMWCRIGGAGLMIGLMVGIGGAVWLQTKDVALQEELMPPMDFENEKLVDDYFNKQS